MRALVLVADADPFELRLLSELCMALGYDVVAAGDGGGVLDAVARDRPRLVVMDHALARPSGFEVLEILKADARLHGVPVVLAMDAGDDAARQRSLDLGAAGCVTKPYRTADVHRCLDAVLGSGAPRQAGAAVASAPGQDLGAAVAGAGTAGQLHLSLEYEFTRAARYEHPLGCVVVRCAADATGAGHAALGGVLRACLRSVDQLFCAAPGDFAILLPETGSLGCAAVVARLHAAARAACAEGASVPDLAVGAAAFPSHRVASGQALWQAAIAAASDPRTS